MKRNTLALALLGTLALSASAFADTLHLVTPAGTLTYEGTTLAVDGGLRTINFDADTEQTDVGKGLTARASSSLAPSGTQTWTARISFDGEGFFVSGCSFDMANFVFLEPGIASWTLDCPAH